MIGGIIACVQMSHLTWQTRSLLLPVVVDFVIITVFCCLVMCDRWHHCLCANVPLYVENKKSIVVVDFVVLFIVTVFRCLVM